MAKLNSAKARLLGSGSSQPYIFSESISRDSISVSVTCHGGPNIFWLKSTCFVASCIRVTGLRVDSIIFYDVVKRPIHESASATTIAIVFGAVDQILFTEGDEFFCFLEVLSFQ